MNEKDREEVQELMTRLADGERQVLPLLYTRLFPSLLAFARRRLGAEDAEDAAQEAFLKLAAAAARFDSSAGDATSWALGCVGWEVRTFLKRHSRRIEATVTLLPDAAYEMPTPEDALMSLELKRDAAAVLATLRAEDISTLECVAGGVRPPIPAATFRKRLQRALDRFRAAWRIRHGDE